MIQGSFSSHLLLTAALAQRCLATSPHTDQFVQDGCSNPFLHEHVSKAVPLQRDSQRLVRFSAASHQQSTLIDATTGQCWIIVYCAVGLWFPQSAARSTSWLTLVEHKVTPLSSQRAQSLVCFRTEFILTLSVFATCNEYASWRIFHNVILPAIQKPVVALGAPGCVPHLLNLHCGAFIFANFCGYGLFVWLQAALAALMSMCPGMWQALHNPVNDDADVWKNWTGNLYPGLIGAEYLQAVTGWIMLWCRRVDSAVAGLSGAVFLLGGKWLGQIFVSHSACDTLLRVQVPAWRLRTCQWQQHHRSKCCHQTRGYLCTCRR